MKNEKMGGTMTLGFTPTNHDPTRTPLTFASVHFPRAYKKQRLACAFGVVGRPIGRLDTRHVSATSRAYAFVTHTNTRRIPR